MAFSDIHLRVTGCPLSTVLGSAVRIAVGGCGGGGGEVKVLPVVVLPVEAGVGGVCTAGVVGRTVAVVEGGVSAASVGGLTVELAGRGVSPDWGVGALTPVEAAVEAGLAAEAEVLGSKRS